MKNKDIEVLIKVPKDWLNMNDLDVLAALLGRIKGRIEDEVFIKAVEKIFKELEIPKIKINKKELKKEVLNKMAERALEDDT